MPRKLDFSVLDQEAEVKESGKHIPRWKSREANPVVQMSLRMQASQYEEFRILCKEERRTNGDMLGVLMEHYRQSQKPKK